MGMDESFELQFSMSQSQVVTSKNQINNKYFSMFLNTYYSKITNCDLKNRNSSF